MKYIKGPRNVLAPGLAAPALALVIAVVAAFGVDSAYGFHVAEDPVTLDGDIAAEEHGDDPESNLPFLFAVFFIAWAAFFAYVFVMSRRQREMRREIEVLKRVLAEKEERAAQAAEPEGESHGP
jgi:CcmD family protein